MGFNSGFKGLRLSSHATTALTYRYDNKTFTGGGKWLEQKSSVLCNQHRCFLKLLFDKMFTAANAGNWWSEAPRDENEMHALWNVKCKVSVIATKRTERHAGLVWCARSLTLSSWRCRKSPNNNVSKLVQDAILFSDLRFIKRHFVYRLMFNSKPFFSDLHLINHHFIRDLCLINRHLV